MPTVEESVSRGRKRAFLREQPRPAAFRIGRSVISTSSQSTQSQSGMGNNGEPERPVNLIIHEPEQGVAASRTPVE